MGNESSCDDMARTTPQRWLYERPAFERASIDSANRPFQRAIGPYEGGMHREGCERLSASYAVARSMAITIASSSRHGAEGSANHQVREANGGGLPRSTGSL